MNVTMLTTPVRAVLISAVLVLSCTTSGCRNDDADLGVIPTVAPAPGTPISLQQDVQPIFTSTCALSGCHGGSSPQLGLDLQDGKSYASLVGVPSAEVPSLQRVEAGSSATSYLVLKIEGDPAILGSRMPPTGSPLSPAEIQIIRDWIDQGALNN